VDAIGQNALTPSSDGLPSASTVSKCVCYRL